MVTQVPYGPIWSGIVLYGSVWSHMFLYGSVWARMVPYFPIWSCMVRVGPVWSQIVSVILRIVTRLVWIVTMIVKIFTRIVRFIRWRYLRIEPVCALSILLLISLQHSLLNPLSLHRNVIPFWFKVNQLNLWLFMAQLKYILNSGLVTWWLWTYISKSANDARMKTATIKNYLKTKDDL